MIKIGHRKYRSIVGEPVEWTDNGKPMQEQVIELSRIHQGLVEEMIRKYPDQWFWMHNRWALPKEKR
jgi:KDO2-lipid IV(A) lauroyltransferase